MRVRMGFGTRGRLLMRRAVVCFLLAAVLGSVPGPLAPQAWAADPQAPPSLKRVPVPEPPGLAEYVANKQAAIQLGKALFWDMQVGSDGRTACASCHFSAGADPRSRNQVFPGGEGFDRPGPNGLLAAWHFPYHQRSAPVDRQSSAVIRDGDDVVSSQGIRLAQFAGLSLNRLFELEEPLSDAVFNLGGKNIRQVPDRNAPSVINAVFNYANFWDGRANHYFNGRNPFGPMDQKAGILVGSKTSVSESLLRLPLASLASQALGPPMSDVEMSFRDRGWPDLGRKLLAVTPLAEQLVHPADSVLGSLSRAKLSGTSVSGTPGLKTTYVSLVKNAFPSKYWAYTGYVSFAPDGSLSGTYPASKAGPGPGQYTQMEANFSFFFGLALQLYQATLVSDDSRFDRFQDDLLDLSSEEKLGLSLFMNDAGCSACHSGSEFTSVSANQILGLTPIPGERADGNPIELMGMAEGVAYYDIGFYNIGVTPTHAGDLNRLADIGRGGSDPWGRPLSFTGLAYLKRAGVLPSGISAYVADLPLWWPAARPAVNGSFKTPSLRNVELTGPYFHNGGTATLMQVVDFYARGGNFPVDNIADLSPEMTEIPVLQGNETRKRALVAFLLTLTDERVRNEQSPFDHPQLFVTNGYDSAGNEVRVQVPPVGAGGRPAANLAPLQPFLGVSPFSR
jgi:cytochrome c peroxidase